MPPAPDARRAAFATFVKRALDHAAVAKGWTPTDVVAATEGKLGRTTLYRWLRGDWEGPPEPAKVVAFCEVLGIPPSAAFTILWPDPDTEATDTPPPAMDPDVVTILRRLNDPNVPDAEKYHIRETLRGLAARPIRRRPA